MSEDKQEISTFSIIAIVLVLSVLGFWLTPGYKPNQPQQSTEFKLTDKKAYESVKQAESLYPGATVLEALQGLLLVSQNLGNLMEIEGWYASKRYIPGKKDSGYDVFLNVRENGTKLDLHWIVDENWTIYPVSDIAKDLCQTQKAKQI